MYAPPMRPPWALIKFFGNFTKSLMEKEKINIEKANRMIKAFRCARRPVVTMAIPEIIPYIDKMRIHFFFCFNFIRLAKVQPEQTRYMVKRATTSKNALEIMMLRISPLRADMIRETEKTLPNLLCPSLPFLLSAANAPVRRDIIPEIMWMYRIGSFILVGDMF